MTCPHCQNCDRTMMECQFILKTIPELWVMLCLVCSKTFSAEPSSQL